VLLSCDQARLDAIELQAGLAWRPYVAKRRSVRAREQWVYVCGKWWDNKQTFTLRPVTTSFHRTARDDAHGL